MHDMAMIHGVSFRFSALFVSLFIHAALLGLFLLVALPAGDAGRAHARHDGQGALVFQLAVVAPDRAAEAVASPAPAALASSKAVAPAKTRPASSIPDDAHVRPTPAGGAAQSVVAAGEGAGDAAAADLSGAATLRYRDQVLAHIGRYRQYPEEARRAHLQGTSWVRFLLDRDGRVLRLAVDQGSGHDMLDREAAAAVRRAEPLPRIPASLPAQIDITVPIDFRIG